ncbi:hypothetical protein B0H13DRAFT_1879561 [Mycena leptocephala]|nr:hypothetical protein B0H13DRAFT_1879561 [Mycena leptocephala]
MSRAPVFNYNRTPARKLTAACEFGLAALNFEEDNGNTTTAPSQSTESTIISSRRNGVDITLRFFSDFLSDAPISGADEVGSLGNWSERAAGGSNSKTKVAGVATWEGEIDTLVS